MLFGYFHAILHPLRKNKREKLKDNNIGAIFALYKLK